MCSLATGTFPFGNFTKIWTHPLPASGGDLHTVLDHSPSFRVSLLTPSTPWNASRIYWHFEPFEHLKNRGTLSATSMLFYAQHKAIFSDVAMAELGVQHHPLLPCDRKTYSISLGVISRGRPSQPGALRSGKSGASVWQTW